MFLYGTHACFAALNNPRRIVERIFLTNKDNQIPNPRGVKVEIVDRKVLESKLSPGAVHQGIVIQVQSLPAVSIEAFADLDGQQRLVVLDQVTDPHNVGAIIRTSAAFDAAGIILTQRCAPKESGVLAKAACGGLEHVPICVVQNLSQALKTLQTFGFWTVGFTEHSDQRLDTVNLKGKIALIVGAEGDGMRRLTKERCDFSVRLPTSDYFSTLNVSNATAIALYETFRQQMI